MTTTTTRRTSGTNGRTAAGSRQRQSNPAITTTPIQQVIPWVKIELKVRADLAEALNSRSEPVRMELGNRVWHECRPARLAIEDGRVSDEHRGVRSVKYFARQFGHLVGVKQAPFSVLMRESHWQDVQRVARVLDIPVEKVLRGFLWKRWQDLAGRDAAIGRAPKLPAISGAASRKSLDSGRVVAFYTDREQSHRWEIAAIANKTLVDDLARRVVEDAALSQASPKLAETPEPVPRECNRYTFRISDKAWDAAVDRAEAIGLDAHEWARRVLLAFLEAEEA